MTFTFKFKRNINDPEEQEKEYNVYHLTVKNIKSWHKKLHYVLWWDEIIVSRKLIQREG